MRRSWEAVHSRDSSSGSDTEPTLRPQMPHSMQASRPALPPMPHLEEGYRPSVQVLRSQPHSYAPQEAASGRNLYYDPLSRSVSLSTNSSVDDEEGLNLSLQVKRGSRRRRTFHEAPSNARPMTNHLSHPHPLQQQQVVVPHVAHSNDSPFVGSSLGYAHRQRLVLDPVHCDEQVRRMRRRVLTALIERMYRRWVLFRQQQGQRRIAVATDCARVYAVHMPFVLGWLYFQKWKRFVPYTQRLRSHVRVLLAIRRQALQRLARQYYHKLRKYGQRSIAAREVRLMGVDNVRRLVILFLRRWTQWALNRRYIRLHIEPSMFYSRRNATKQFLRSYLHRWRAVYERNASLRALTSVSVFDMLRRYFCLWKRRRHRSLQRNSLQGLMRRSVRRLAKRCLFHWSNWTTRRQEAQQLEQQSLAPIASRYLNKWITWRVILSRLWRLQRRSSCVLAETYFSTWSRFLMRRIRAVQLEQQTLVCLLLSYYAKWKLSIIEKRLTYRSASRSGSTSYSLARRSYSRDEK